MGDSYKKAKEAFVSDATGSSVLHINLISLVALCSIALYSALSSRLPSSRPIQFPTAWIILVFPLLLSMTLFANHAAFLSLLLLAPTALLLLLPRQQSGTPLPSPSSPRLPSAPEPQSRLAPLASLTVYRAHMMLMTILAILAVDFPVFPRSLAKCETFGVSLMDLGVGSFVFSQGIVSAIPLLKDPSYLSAPAGPKLLSVTRKVLPIIILGVVRVLLVKGTEYPEHESEYGTHWNFFITLALLPILQVALHPVIKRVPPALIGVMVAVAQQMTLSSGGLQKFVLDAPRTGLISANKEGIVSLPGYLAVHLLGLSAGTLVLPPSPKYFSRSLKAQGRPRRSSNAAPADPRNSLGAPRHNDKTAIELCSYTVVWWTLFGLSKVFGIGDGVSRRMVNFPYIFWVAAFNTSFMLGYLLLDLIFFPSKSVYSQTSKLKVPVDNLSHPSQQQQQAVPPALLEAINKNSLALFLLANVATGLVNLTIPTMYTSDFWAMVVLSVYAFGVSFTAWMLRSRRLLQL
ncbi:GPI-anchored wall transfer protein 1 [Hypsizygus marmoreus]|uniref:GPI-anchored wall transfer protein n=1 Tax=Hypsizygus marmoreus TaxID=39966 RepID=A0A369K4S7_HYPMA|nr:GPI-anchored wall transfer protein 1 [Hypsizygus marmoreus]